MVAVQRLLESLQGPMARGDLETVSRGASRIFLELHPDDLRGLLSTMTEGWLKGMISIAGPARAGAASLWCRQAIEAAVHKRWSDAARDFLSARAVYAELLQINAMMELFALGAQRAGERAALVEAREKRLEPIVLAASGLMTTPGRRAEALPLFRQALQILEEDPDRPQDRERWEKIQQLVVDLERTGAVEPVGPAAQLPPAYSLQPSGWDDLGMQLFQTHPLQAKICFERAAVGQPERALYWLHLAMCLGVVGAPQQDVISAYAQVIIKDPSEWRGWIGLASSLQEASRFDEAIAAWDKTLEVVPHKDHPLRQRAFCVEAYQLQVQGQSWDAKAWHTEASRRLDAKQWNLADFAFTRALEISPVYPGALMGKGLANFQWATELKTEGNSAAILRFKIAKDALERARSLRPDAPGVGEILAECDKEIQIASRASSS